MSLDCKKNERRLSLLSSQYAVIRKNGEGKGRTFGEGHNICIHLIPCWSPGPPLMNHICYGLFGPYVSRTFSVLADTKAFAVVAPVPKDLTISLGRETNR